MNPKTIDRLKSQLLTSGIQQKDQPLFQVINTLIDALRDNSTVINTFTGGGGGGSIFSQPFLTHEDVQGVLPNSRQLIRQTGTTFNKTGKNLIISTEYPEWNNYQESEPGPQGPPGIQGIPGIMGPAGPPGLDGDSCDDIFQLLGFNGPTTFGLGKRTQYDIDFHVTPSFIQDTGVVLTATGTNPTLGSSTLSSVYYRLGRLVAYQIVLVVNTTGWNPGAGTYLFSVPGNFIVHLFAAGRVFDASASRQYPFQFLQGTATSIFGFLIDPAGSLSATNLGATTPITWATGDQIAIGGFGLTTP